MSGRAIIVIDIGKTASKLTLWTRDGVVLDRRARANAADGASLDVAGIEAWLAATLTEFARQADVGAIIPAAHGAAAAIMRQNGEIWGPIDYERGISTEIMGQYGAMRDPFAHTGSPCLPNGLNLGAQLFALELEHPEALAGPSQILLWPQYWAWRLSGVAASEVTSLGCHSDLWAPAHATASTLATARGWAARLPPLRRAGEALGPITPDWAARTGLPADTQIYCGLHDSNAALVAARGFPALADGDATVLSTGTWFVAMRVPKAGEIVDIDTLPETRDCLVNVAADGALIPSARFMGGRELDILTDGVGRVDDTTDQTALLAAAADAVAAGCMALPSFVPSVGPFPRGAGRWINPPVDAARRRAAACLYAALVADVGRDLIGARGVILIEGRFARAELFVRALAALRPGDAVYVPNDDVDVSFGALRLLEPALKPAGALTRVTPLAVSLSGYKRDWRVAAETQI